MKRGRKRRGAVRTHYQNCFKCAYLRALSIALWWGGGLAATRKTKKSRCGTVREGEIRSKTVIIGSAVLSEFLPEMEPNVIFCGKVEYEKEIIWWEMQIKRVHKEEIYRKILWCLLLWIHFTDSTIRYNIPNWFFHNWRSAMNAFASGSWEKNWTLKTSIANSWNLLIISQKSYFSNL